MHTARLLVPNPASTSALTNELHNFRGLATHGTLCGYQQPMLLSPSLSQRRHLSSQASPRLSSS